MKRKSQKNSYHVIGKNALELLLAHSPNRIISIQTSHENQDKLIEEAKSVNIPIIKKDRKKLEALTNSTSHQGYVAQVREREELSLETFINQSKKKEKSLVVILDSIFDPQNVGTIFRASECFGVDAVIFSKNRGCKVTSTVTKTSVGATELVPMIEVSNLLTSIEKLQKAGYWSVAAELSSKSTPIYTFDYPSKTALVLGSEGKGVQKIISKKVDFHIEIPMYGKIDSLNVSQASAIFLHTYAMQHQIKKTPLSIA